MLPFFRLAPVLGVVVSAWLLSGCTVPPAAVAVATPAPAAAKDDGCPLQRYARQGDTAVAIPAEVAGQTIADVLVPGGRPVGCENPRFRLVKGDERDARALFERLTRGSPKMGAGQSVNLRDYGLRGLMTEVRMRPDGIAVGWRGHAGCERPLVWISKWPGELDMLPGVGTVLLEFTGEPSVENCRLGPYRDADGGGP